jgi:preprotein translocase subunit SecB
MNPSPLQLERHFFTKVQIDSNPAGKAGASNLLNCEAEFGQAADNPKRYQVVLRLKLLTNPQNDSCYTGEIHAVGIFRVIDGWPAEKEMTLVEANGLALLYGAIRELLCNLTARGPWPQVVLSSVTFVQPKTKPQAGAAGELPPATAKAA